MTTFSIQNFGCRATEADASALRGELLARGLAQVQEPASANVIVLNTCTVTAAADSQAREAVRKLHRANPDAQIIVTGCYAQRAPEEIASIGGVAWVVGNSHQSEIPRLVGAVTAPNTPSGATVASDGPQRIGADRATPDFVPLAQIAEDEMSLARGPAKILTGDIFAQTSVQIAPAGSLAGDRTRPILKVQDGCNNRCSYCVIPLVRGRSRSLPPDTVVDEVRQLHAACAKEIVLSGINLGSYGRDLAPRAGLPNLVRRILDETEIERIRFSSIELQDVTEDFVSLMAASNRLARHFHVPLQSGSDRILRAMHRWYRTEHYAQRIELIRRLLPEAAIGADVIVGFPGETDEDFAATCDFIERLPFTYLHVFSFSERPGTGAQERTNTVAQPLIRERARELRALGQKKSADFRATQSGRVARVLTLNRRGENWTDALTGNYLKVRLAGLHPANEWHEVRITQADNLVGSLSFRK
ncbi:MAG TPA: tRNA (N(6)-L-threonylcarbamoyladenosine(37)-C(2))-methylthiotransferase MtaB [Candidatus Dormibacteraeota bacterium]|nr:tRNA (N(6)-L-threonylcarbamoyladenosine(37)-C(2))-methylthiotransferase MtaB [Candidatus Dormibacteraeota bacterium]